MANGGGHALVIRNPERKVDDWRNWTVSTRPGGGPGTESGAANAGTVANLRTQLQALEAERSALQRLLSGTCGQRVITLPPLAPKDTGTTVSSTSGNCDPAYPTVCIPPPPPDLDCSDVPYRNFTVLPPDPHHFDGNGDGIGCSG